VVLAHVGGGHLSRAQLNLRAPVALHDAAELLGGQLALRALHALAHRAQRAARHVLIRQPRHLSTTPVIQLSSNQP
jgi:hypothetical protein